MVKVVLYVVTYNPLFRQFVSFRFEKKILFQNNEKFGYSFIKSGIVYMYLPFIYKKPLSLFEIAALNFTVYILTILTCSLIKNHVFRKHVFLKLSELKLI